MKNAQRIHGLGPASIDSREAMQYLRHRLSMHCLSMHQPAAWSETDMTVLIVFLDHGLRLLFLLGAAYFLVLSISNIVWLRLSSHAPRITRGRMVSVLVPARDEEKNIGPCLDSLLEQTYANYEIVVVNDQSTDRTGEILRE